MNYRSGSSYEQQDDWQSPLFARSGNSEGGKTKRQGSEKSSEIFKEVEEWSRYLAGHLGISLPDEMKCGTVSDFVPQINLNCETNREAPSTFNHDETFILDWNRDRIPKGVKSMSDWTVKVYNGSDAKIYEVHKSILSFGPRRSMFFIKEFEESRQRQHAGIDITNASISEVALPAKAASCMPNLLDYIYMDEVDLNSNNAVALKFLANHFDVRPLYTMTIAFIEHDLTAEKALLYVQEADTMKDRDIANLAMKVAAENFKEFSQESLMDLSPVLFQRLVSHSAIMTTPENLSEIIAAYIRYHPLEMNHELFFLLTNANILPRISANEAFWYLNYGAETFRGILVDESFGGTKGSLKGRCIFAITSQWRNSLLPAVSASLDQPSSVNLIDKSKAYRNLPSDIKLELLEHALLSASGETNHEVRTNAESNQPPSRVCFKESRDDANNEHMIPSNQSRDSKTVQKKFRPNHLEKQRNYCMI